MSEVEMLAYLDARAEPLDALRNHLGHLQHGGTDDHQDRSRNAQVRGQELPMMKAAHAISRPADTPSEAAATDKPARKPRIDPRRSVQQVGRFFRAWPSP